MTSRDHLRAAARCWERAGFYEVAAERFTTAEAWRDAGRCFSQAERHTNAALAFSHAGEPLLEAREQLTGGWPEHARSLYERLRSGTFIFPAAHVEVLLGLGELDEAIRVALKSGDCEAVAMLACLADGRGRSELASALATERPGERFIFWNRSLRRQFAPAAPSKAKAWPKVEFTEVALVPIWEERITSVSWGDPGLDWSADSSMFAAALWDQGFARGRLGPIQVRLERWKPREWTRCVRFLPGDRAFLTGHSNGEVRLVLDDGTVRQIDSLRMSGTVGSIAFSPQGDRVAVAARLEQGAQLQVSTWQTDRARFRLEDLRQAEGYDPLVSWTRDGRSFFWSPGPENKTNRIFAADKKLPGVHRSSVTSLAFTPDGQFLLSASTDRTLVVRDSRTAKIVAPQQQFSNDVLGANVHPKAALIAVGEGHEIHLFRLQTLTPPALLKLHEKSLRGSIMSLAFSPDGRHLLVMTWGHLYLLRVELKL